MVGSILIGCDKWAFTMPPLSPPAEPSPQPRWPWLASRLSPWCGRPDITQQLAGPGGMCYFNNMAIAVQRIRPRGKMALIMDIDLHFGYGTASIFRGDSKVKIVNSWSMDEDFEYLNMEESRYLRQAEDAFLGYNYDIVGVSAGFDTYQEDWGGLLKIGDYEKMGRAIREGAERCGGRRFAALDGGYHPDLKWCIKSFVEGFE